MTEETNTRRKVRISPVVRLTLSFDREVRRDKNEVFNHDFLEQYLIRHLESQEKLNQNIRSLVMVNTLIFAVLSGQNWSIPFADIQISKLPAILEILVFYSSTTFFLLCATFVTKQCYAGIIDQCGNIIVSNDNIDPDFYNAASKHFDFFLKLYRPKLNIWGVDFFEHGKGFFLFSLIVSVILLAVLLLFPIVHVALITASSLQVLHSDWGDYVKILMLGSIVVINLGGLAMVFGMLINFDFFEIGPTFEPEVQEKLAVNREE